MQKTGSAKQFRIIWNCLGYTSMGDPWLQVGGRLTGNNFATFRWRSAAGEGDIVITDGLILGGLGFLTLARVLCYGTRKHYDKDRQTFCMRHGAELEQLIPIVLPKQEKQIEYPSPPILDSPYSLDHILDDRVLEELERQVWALTIRTS